ncbi:MAG: BLUF domain-containing protein [Gammaproteobacteria bacterium]|nr:BLUF domain-containing protein [Gammaproteobacteria bacterium]
MEVEQTDENLIHCIYASAATAEFTPKDLEELLSVARKNNEALGVTGMLLYEKGSFFQILEGAPEAVESLFEKISADKRHSRISKLILEPIEARSFANWSMGHAAVPVRKLSEIEGLNDFFQAGKCFTGLDDGRAKILLKAFRDGQWRSTITGK